MTAASRTDSSHLHSRAQFIFAFINMTSLPGILTAIDAEDRGKVPAYGKKLSFSRLDQRKNPMTQGVT